MIQDQKDLQRQYGELVDKRSTLTGYANAKKLQATEAQITEVTASSTHAHSPVRWLSGAEPEKTAHERTGNAATLMRPMRLKSAFLHDTRWVNS